NCYAHPTGRSGPEPNRDGIPGRCLAPVGWLRRRISHLELAMAGKKNQRAFFCSDCGHETVRWLGQCPGCGAWNTLAEAPTESRSRKAHSGAAGWLGVSNGRPVVLQDVDEANEER